MQTLPLASNARSNADNWPVEGRRRIIGDPDEVVSVLVSDGFSECKREVLRRRGGSRPLGGVWQGLNRSSGLSPRWCGFATATQQVRWFTSRSILPHVRVDGLYLHCISMDAGWATSMLPAVDPISPVLCQSDRAFHNGDAFAIGKPHTDSHRRPGDDQHVRVTNHAPSRCR